MSEIMKGFAHGMRVGTTGDSSRLQRMAAEVTRTSTVARAWQNGPIPPPSMLGLYGEVSPDLPDRIMRMAEKDRVALVGVGGLRTSCGLFAD